MALAFPSPFATLSLAPHFQLSLVLVPHHGPPAFPAPPPPPRGRIQLPCTCDIWHGVTPQSWAGAGDRPRQHKHIPGVYIAGTRSTHQSAGCCPCLFPEGSRPGRHRRRRAEAVFGWLQLSGCPCAGDPRQTCRPLRPPPPALSQPPYLSPGTICWYQWESGPRWPPCACTLGPLGPSTLWPLPCSRTLAQTSRHFLKSGGAEPCSRQSLFMLSLEFSLGGARPITHHLLHLLWEAGWAGWGNPLSTREG